MPSFIFEFFRALPFIHTKACASRKTLLEKSCSHLPFHFNCLDASARDGRSSVLQNQKNNMLAMLMEICRDQTASYTRTKGRSVCVWVRCFPQGTGCAYCISKTLDETHIV